MLVLFEVPPVSSRTLLFNKLVYGTSYLAPDGCLAYGFLRAHEPYSTLVLFLFSFLFLFFFFKFRRLRFCTHRLFILNGVSPEFCFVIPSHSRISEARDFWPHNIILVIEW